jgi:amino acid transporter
MKNKEKLIALFGGALTIFFSFCAMRLLFLRLYPESNLRSVYDLLSLVFAVCALTACGILIYALVELNRQNNELPKIITRITLLTDSNSTDRLFLLSGKESALIGKGDEAYVDLEHAEQSHLISYEHAILNQVADNWYLECVSEEFEVGLKRAANPYVYKVKPGICYKLYINDVLYIAGERLLLG